MKKYLILLSIMLVCLVGCNTQNKENTNQNKLNHNQYEENTNLETNIENSEELEIDNISSLKHDLEKKNFEEIVFGNGDTKDITINGKEMKLSYNSFSENGEMKYEIKNLLSEAVFHLEKIDYDGGWGDDSSALEEIWNQHSIAVSKIIDLKSEKEYLIIDDRNGRAYLIDENLNLVSELAYISHVAVGINMSGEYESFDYIQIYGNQIIYYIDDNWGCNITNNDSVEYFKDESSNASEKLLIKRRVTIEDGKLYDVILEEYDDFMHGMT